MIQGENKLDALGPLAYDRLKGLEEKRRDTAARLSQLLDPENKLGRWSPHYLPELQALYRIEMQIDGFCAAHDLDVRELPKLLKKRKRRTA